MSRMNSLYKQQVNEWDIAKKIVEQSYLTDQNRRFPDGISNTFDSKINKTSNQKGMFSTNNVYSNDESKKKRWFQQILINKPRIITAIPQTLNFTNDFDLMRGSQTWKEFKGPLEHYSDMLCKNKTYSQRHSDLSNRRNQIKENELFHREEVKRILEKKWIKLKK